MNAFQDGWFKTGDIGHIDADGYLSVTDRKKELIKTSGGKFIAPQPIENSLKLNPLVGTAAILGDKRKFCFVIISPNFALLEGWAASHEHFLFLARRTSRPSQSSRRFTREIVEEVNQNLARFEKLKRVLLVPDEFSADNGALTPTLKLRRRVIEDRYRTQIDDLYAQAGDHNTLIVQPVIPKRRKRTLSFRSGAAAEESAFLSASTLSPGTHVPPSKVFNYNGFMTDPLVIAGRSFRSRLIVGTGKYKSFQETARALEASGAEMVTVAVRRVNLDRSKESLLDYIDPKKYFLLPNTAGCYTADEAIRAARLGREVGLSDWVKTRGHRRPGHALPRRASHARGHARSGQRRLHRPALHFRRHRLRQASC